MEKIDLKEILSKHSTNYRTGITLKSSMDGNYVVTGKEAIAAMQEAWNTAVDECKKSATTVTVDAYNHEDKEPQRGHDTQDIVDLDSIEQVKQMIL